MSNLKRYFVQLTYPKATRQPVYCTELTATTEAEAVLQAETDARCDGWTGSSLKWTCRLVAKEHAA